MRLLFRILAIFLIVSVALYSWTYLVRPEFAREQWGHHLASVPWAFYGHVVLGPVALLAGCLQFYQGLRTARPHVHRWCGRVYVAACCLGGLGGFILAFGSIEGPIAVSGFAVLAALWTTFTIHGAVLAKAGNYLQHRRWMLRSYALTLSAVSLRLMMPTAAILGIDGAYPYIAWLCWLVNLILVELYLRAKPGPAAQAA